MIRALPDIATLRSALDYDPLTGALTFKARPDARPCWNSRHAGKAAMTVIGHDGYVRGYLFGKMTLAHRVVFALHHGRTDVGFIDHINGNRSDNRAANLREVSRTDNAKNKAKPSNSTTGHIGVSRTYDGRYRAHITLNDKTRHLGRFTAIEDAIEARRLAEIKFGFHPNHGRPLFIEAAA